MGLIIHDSHNAGRISGRRAAERPSVKSDVGFIAAALSCRKLAGAD